MTEPKKTKSVAAEPPADARELIAYHPAHRPPTVPVPAPRWREWMNFTTGRGANRCLPLLMANESGWVLPVPAALTVVWDGGVGRDAIKVKYADDTPAYQQIASSHFGSGVLTFDVPYLFRTSPGYNLIVRGPTNWPKDGICALDGIVETDWSVATFTMNWKLTRPDNPVSFEEGEPFCMIMPQRRGELAAFTPALRQLEDDEGALAGYSAWQQGREEVLVKKFLSEYSRDFEEYVDFWQRQYFKGRYPTGDPAPEHETKVRLGEFVEKPAHDEA
jgi:hypothetical protein